MKKYIACITLLLLFCSVQAQGPEFTVKEENVEVYINNDATVEIWYYFTIETTRGPQRGIYVGIPTNAIFEYAGSQNGRMLTVEKETDRLKVFFLDEVQTGAVTEIKVSFIAEGMIYPDEAGRLGVEFIPTWYDDSKTEVLRVKFILPEGCDISEVGNYPATAENRGMEGGRAFVYFERANLSKGYQFMCGVSFPEQYVVPAETRVPVEEKAAPGINTMCCFAFILLFVIGAFIVFYTIAKKIKYMAPKLEMESLGARKDLDPVEAAYVLDGHPLKLVNLILLSLVKKGAIRILEWGPVKAEILEVRKETKAFNCPNCGGPLDSALELQFCQYWGREIRLSGNLTYYENPFLLTCIKKDGTLDQDSVTQVLETLYKKVDAKLSGYSRVKTAEFYKGQIQQYWADIHTATEEDRYNLFGERVDWLMSDPDFDKKTRDNFGGLSTPYTPSSWWIWYNLGKASNGDEFSESISKARKNVEDKSGLSKNSLEKNWEKHATPGRPSTKVSHAHKSCVCACVSCACACACVSCACACASGGGF